VDVRLQQNVTYLSKSVSESCCSNVQRHTSSFKLRANFEYMAKSNNDNVGRKTNARLIYRRFVISRAVSSRPAVVISDGFYKCEMDLIR
jgi:hypothetical protein